MRTSDIAYVPQGHLASMPVPPLNEMTLQEITKRYLATCIKSHGLVSECAKCKDKCPYGTRAVSLAYGDGMLGGRAVPYEGSMLQKARMENELERKRKTAVDALKKQLEKTEKEIEAVREEAKDPKRKLKSQDPEGWYEDALKSGDPVKYVMENMNRTKTQAKKKLCNFLYHRPEMKEIQEKYVPKTDAEENTTESSTVAQETPVCEEKPCNVVETEANGDAYVSKVMEQKLEELMNQQEKLETAIKEYQTKLVKIKEQIDTICKTMDIFKTA